MDSRVRRHAEILVDHSTDVAPDDRVVVTAPPVAEDLAVAVAAELGERGARPALCYPGRFGTSRFGRAYLRATDEDAVAEADHLTGLYEDADAIIRLRGDENVAETSDVEASMQSAADRAYAPTLDAILDSRWCLTQYPAPGNAQLAEMSTEAYEEFVWNAVDKDWEAQREHQRRMVEILDPAEEVRIVSSSETDISMSVAGMKAINDYGKHNLPGGEVFTAPVPESVEGTVRFDLPLYHNGREIEDAFLEFEDGEVVAHDAERNADRLAEILNTDPGARRLGELGIGMNRDIDQFTYNMLFDEKMGDTVHLAVGMAYEECVPEGEPNESAAHVDMIVDMSEDSRIEVDGDVVQRDGVFSFEE